MDAAVEAWNTMTWFDGFLFTVWIAALYIGKLKIDQKFARKTIYKVKLVDDARDQKKIDDKLNYDTYSK
jgi:hypothetical protein